MKMKLQLFFLVLLCQLLSFSSQKDNVCPKSLSYYTAKCEKECDGIKDVDFNTFDTFEGKTRTRFDSRKCEVCILSATPSGCSRESADLELYLYRSPENYRSERSLVSKIVVIDISLLRKYEILIFSQDSCIICILKVVQGFYHCAGSGNAEEVLNCILDYVGATYSHCNECICWIICLIGPTTEECQRCSGSK